MTRIVAVLSLLGSVLEVIEKLRLFLRKLVLNWDNCLEDILIAHFFLYVVLVVLCVLLFLLINLSSFVLYFFFC